MAASTTLPAEEDQLTSSTRIAAAVTCLARVQAWSCLRCLSLREIMPHSTVVVKTATQLFCDGNFWHKEGSADTSKECQHGRPKKENSKSSQSPHDSHVLAFPHKIGRCDFRIDPDPEAKAL